MFAMQDILEGISRLDEAEGEIRYLENTQLGMAKKKREKKIRIV